jgi:hypothetical protein
MACHARDVATVVGLAHRFRSQGIVTFAMGPLGMTAECWRLSPRHVHYASLSDSPTSRRGDCDRCTLRTIYAAIGSFCYADNWHNS